jgi:hypothetical protein
LLQDEEEFQRRVAAALEGQGQEEDEDRLIEERRRRRQEILAKHREQQQLSGGPGPGRVGLESGLGEARGQLVREGGMRQGGCVETEAVHAVTQLGQDSGTGGMGLLRTPKKQLAAFLQQAAGPLRLHSWVSGSCPALSFQSC